MIFRPALVAWRRCASARLVPRLGTKVVDFWRAGSLVAGRIRSLGPIYFGHGWRLSVSVTLLD
jgi:hypothetical protein